MQLSFANRTTDPITWQQYVRAKLFELTQSDHIPQAYWRVLEVTESEVRGVLRRRHLIQYGSWPPQPIYELLPAGGELNGRTLIAFHGHGHEPFGGIYVYLDELPQRGYRCVMPILFGTMERQTLGLGRKPPTELCREWLIEADRFGVSLLGLRLFEGWLAYQFALSLPGVDPRRIGSVGLSMGGQLALYLAAIEPAMRNCVCAGFLCTFDGLLIRKRNCHCYSIRDWPSWFDMPDIAGCVAPRPLLTLKGEDDACFFADDVQEAADRVAEVYRAFGPVQNFCYATYPGKHCMNVDMADQWLQQL